MRFHSMETKVRLFQKFWNYTVVVKKLHHPRIFTTIGYVRSFGPPINDERTVGKKSIRALEIVLAIFLCFECQFLSFYACYKEYKA